MTIPLAILGLGGVGGTIAARTGALCIGTPRVVDAISSSGLTLVHNQETVVVHPEATGRLETPVALLVIAVKAPDLDDALDRIEPAVLQDAVVLPLLNGLEHLDEIRARLGATVAAGSIGRFEAFSRAPGHIVQMSSGALIRAACGEIAPDVLVQKLEVLRHSGIEVSVSGNEREVLWEKAARLAVLAASTSASGEPIGVLRDSPSWRQRMRAALEEACAVAAADGVRLVPTEQWAIIEAMPATLTTSTARDVAAGRPSELDAITGSVIRAGGRLGVATLELRRLMEDACRPR